MSTDKELADLLEQVAKKLREQSKPLEPEFQKIIYDNLWDLYIGQPVPRPRPMCESCKRGGVCGCYQPEFDSPRC